MSVQSIRLRKFRSYEEDNFSFKPGINLIVGLNGAGKTNLLEAVYLLAAGRSWRGADKDLVTHGAAGYLVQGQVEAAQLAVSYSQPDGKRLLINTKSARPEKFVGKLGG